MECSRSHKECIGQEGRSYSVCLWNDKSPGTVLVVLARCRGIGLDDQVASNPNHSMILRRKYQKMNGSAILVNLNFNKVCRSGTACFFYSHFNTLIAFPRSPLGWEQWALVKKISKSLLQCKLFVSIPMKEWLAAGNCCIKYIWWDCG